MDLNNTVLNLVPIAIYRVLSKWGLAREGQDKYHPGTAGRSGTTGLCTIGDAGAARAEDRLALGR